MRVLLRSILVAALVALAAPSAHAGRPLAPEPSEPPSTRQIEVSEVAPQLRAGSRPVEFTVTLRNAGRAPLFLEPHVEVRGRALPLGSVTLELFDPAANTWASVVLDPTRNNHASLPYRGTRALSATTGRMAPGESVVYRLRYAFAAAAEPQQVRIEVGGDHGVPAPGPETHFDSVALIPLSLWGADGARPPAEHVPGDAGPPTVPNAGADDFGGMARAVGDNVRGGGPAFGLSEVPAWIRAGAGAFEFRVTMSNSTPTPIPDVVPQLLVTGGDLELGSDRMGVEVLAVDGGTWHEVRPTGMVDPSTGRIRSQVVDLVPGGVAGGLTVGLAEMTQFTVRVWFPEGSAAIGHDIAVLAGMGLSDARLPSLISHSDFHVFQVTAGGAPTAAPTLVPRAPSAMSTPPPKAAADKGRDPVTLATIALWVALAGLGGVVVYFAHKNRRAGPGPNDDPYA